jgi:hypothetical protein
MPEPESFEAFYARTVWSVTSQMHALAGEDGAADHAIREAYARAYQQWYEISGNPDTEGWVLAAAQDAYQRRRPEAVPTLGEAAPAGQDSLSWPGLYRPAQRDAEGVPGDSTIGVMSPPPAATKPWRGADQRVPPGWAQPPGQPAPPERPGQGGQPRSATRLLALTAGIAVLVAAAVVYLTVGHHPSGQPAHHHTAAKRNQPVMLGAGQTGTRASIPWSIVRAGWTLAEVSQAAPGATQPGTVVTYLVDPRGGRYQIQTWSPAATPRLLAWSGDTQNALFAVPASAGASATYELLSTRTGAITSVPLPAGVTAVGFSRPDGQAIVAVRQAADAFRLQRYNLQGTFEATIGTLPRKSGSPAWLPGCGTACGALSSPDGDQDVWGVAGDEMQLVSNAGGLVRRLKPPGAAQCVPLSWWDTSTVLSYCAASASAYPAGQLWLVPTDGSAPTSLTEVSGTAAGTGIMTGAWAGPGGVDYATQTSSAQCQGAASGPGGLTLLKLSPGGAPQPVAVHGTTGNDTSVVLVSGGRLLVLAQTSCPGQSSLLWLDPSTGTTTPVLTTPAGQVGVLAAVPFGLGPTATSAG